jgi:hypothetical protein
MSDFYKDLAVWVHAFCDEQDRQRRAAQDLYRRERDIQWITRYIAELEVKARRKPSTAKEIEHWKYARRRLELEIAFSEQARP